MHAATKYIFQKIRYLLKKTDQFLESNLYEKAGLPMDQSLEVKVSRYLLKKKATIALAESCTGGLVAHRLTNVPGSSEYFLFSGVTYSNESKINLLGVAPETIETYGAVHEETAKEMAKGAIRAGKATYGLSTTGIAGPTGGTNEKPVGTICIGLATHNMVMGSRFHFPSVNRLKNKEAFATAALQLLLNELEKHQ